MVSNAYNTDMSTSELARWEPTELQYQAAELRAAGYTLSKIAKEIGVSTTTVELWNRNENFKELVYINRQELMSNLEPKIGLLMDYATDVMIAVMKGEIHGDDHRADIARKILRDTAFRLMVARVGGGPSHLQKDSD